MSQSNKQKILNLWRNIKPGGKKAPKAGAFAARRIIPAVGAAAGVSALYKNVPKIAKGLKGLKKERKELRQSKKALKKLQRKASLSESPKQKFERIENDAKHQAKHGLITQEEADKVIREGARELQTGRGKDFKY